MREMRTEHTVYVRLRIVIFQKFRPVFPVESKAARPRPPHYGCVCHNDRDFGRFPSAERLAPVRLARYRKQDAFQHRRFPRTGRTPYQGHFVIVEDDRLGNYGFEIFNAYFHIGLKIGSQHHLRLFLDYF
jgi:hypothetical protein